MIAHAMKRLLICSTEFPPGPGGIGTHAWQLARHLTRLGWEVRVAACQDYVSDREIHDWNTRQSFKVARLPSGQGSLRALWTRSRILRRQLADFGPNLVVASGLKSLWIWAAQADKRVPWVAIGHGSEFNLPPGWARWLTLKAMNSTSRVVCVSEYTRDLAIALGVPRATTQVIFNGADEEEYYATSAGPDACRRQLSANTEHVLLTVGHVSERKAQDIVIRALPQVLSQFPNAQYAIAGIPTLQPQLTALAESLGVSSHVHFLGRVTATQLRDWFNACDVFVLTSRSTSTGDCEGFGIVAVEAALCGKPAIVTRDSGLAEAVVDGVTGLTVPQENPDATAAALVRLLGDPVFRQAAGHAALTRASAEFTWSHRVLEYDQLFREVIGAPRSEPRERPTEPQAAIP